MEEENQRFRAPLIRRAAAACTYPFSLFTLPISKPPRKIFPFLLPSPKIFVPYIKESHKSRRGYIQPVKISPSSPPSLPPSLLSVSTFMVQSK